MKNKTLLLIIALLLSVTLLVWTVDRRNTSAQQGSYDKFGRLMMATDTAGVPCYIVSQRTTVCTSAPGTLYRIVVNTPLPAAKIDVYDVPSDLCIGTPQSGKKAGILLPLTLTNPPAIEYQMNMDFGVCIVTSGATDITVLTD